MSPYVENLRKRLGHSLLLLPGVTAVVRDGTQFLLARQADSERWSLVGGGIEPGEEPRDALVREVSEELGCTPAELEVLGAYGGPDLISAYPNGDQVAYITIAYLCVLPREQLELDREELSEVGWFEPAEIEDLPRHPWIDRVITDATAHRSAPKAPYV